MDKDKVQIGEFAKTRDVLGLFKAFENISKKREDEIAEIIKAVLLSIDKSNSKLDKKGEEILGVIKDVYDEVNTNVKNKVKPILERLEYLEKTYKRKIENSVFETRGDLLFQIDLINRKIATVKEYLDRLRLEKGDKGDTGSKGDKPKHQWDGTKIRFENSDGSWGQWVDLKGSGGGFSFFGGSSPGIERIKSNGSVVKNGATEIDFGSGLTVTNTSNGVRVDSTGGGSSTPQDVTLSYTGDNVTNVTLEDGTEFDLSYTGDNLTTVTDGTYTWTLNYTSDNLTSVTV